MSLLIFKLNPINCNNEQRSTQNKIIQNLLDLTALTNDYINLHLYKVLCAVVQQQHSAMMSRSRELLTRYCLKKNTTILRYKG